MREAASTRRRLIPLAILFVTIIAYLPAMRAGYVWDDDAYVTGNELLRSADGLSRIWLTTETPQYYPMVFTSFWIEYRLWGLHPAGYHAVNVLLHAINALLVGFVLTRLGVRGSWWVAALFAVHPVHVESVAWVTERKNVLSAFFYLAAFLSYLRFERTQREADYGSAFLLYVLGLLSKTVTSTLPVVLALVAICRRGRLALTEAIRLVPFVLTALVLGIVTIRLEGGIIEPVAGEFGFSLLQRVWIACRALVFYAVKIVVPYPLIFNYPRWRVDRLAFTDLWAPVVILVVAGLLALAWRRGYRGAACAAAFFAITLFPASGLFDVYPFRYSFVADHFQYLASLGILSLIVGAAYLVRDRMTAASGRDVTRGFALLGVAVVVLLSGMTFKQSRAYRNAETLWRHTLKHNPTSWIANSNLGLTLLDAGRAEQALERFDVALSSRPGSVESRTGHAMALVELGRFDEAQTDFDLALAADPTYPQARLQRADLYFKWGQPERALPDLDAFLQANPSYSPALQARGMIRVRQGEHAAAFEDFTRAIDAGAVGRVHADRGMVLVELERYPEALADFAIALAANPADLDSYHNRGIAFLRLGDAARARADFEHLLSVDPAAVRTWLALGAVSLELENDPVAACRSWKRACEAGSCEIYRRRCGGVQP